MRNTPTPRRRHSCEVAEWRINLLRDNELPPAEAVALRGHLQGCARCQEALRPLDGLFVALGSGRLPEVEEGDKTDE